MIVTARMLRKAGACKKEVARLVSLYGEHVDVTEEWALEHAHDGVDWSWAAVNLLSASALHEYEEAIAPAQRAYREATEPAWRTYDEAMKAAWSAYDKATASAGHAYDEAPLRVYNKATESAWRSYDEARAVAFARALNA